MNLLVVGKRRETHALARLLRADGRQSAQYFADHAAALAAVGQSGAGFDFVLLEAGENTAAHRELTNAIRSRNRRVPIAIVSYSGDLPSAQPKLIGVFENSSEGLRILNCIMTNPQSGVEGNCACDLGPIIFEYQPRPEQGS